MIGRSNTKIDQIRALEAEINGRFPESIPESNQGRPRNTRIDDIRALESEVALKFPVESADSDETGHKSHENRGEGEDRPPSRRSTSRTNTGLEELRSREIESLSRRALATTRLDEFRGRNIGTSRSPSPEIARRPSSEALRASSLFEERLERLRGKENDKLGNGIEVPNSTVSQNTLRDRSRLTKRGSFVHSDFDPTERIEGEMKLFAPLENQSERGSLRVPSPEPEEDAPEETPRVSRVDPLTQPTPRVTGAFVETPATVKVEKAKDLIAVQPAENQAFTWPTTSLRTDGDVRSRASLPQREENGTAARKHKRAQSAGGDRAAGRSSLLPARRRARSLSRNRRPLTNSAKPPTVKEDLLAIQRANQIEDSTLDDLADYLNEDHLEATLKSRNIKIEETTDDKLDMEKELEAYDRMSRSLKTGLLGIRSAKQGIQRLEDQVPLTPGNQLRTARPTSTSPPRLWHRHPKFRFTLLGLTLFILSAWYIAESAMCYRFCKPEYCYPGVPCSGRRTTRRGWRLEPEVRDWLADVWDDVTGTDIRSVDTEGYSWEQKRQWRRRMAKKGLTRKFVVRPEDKEIFSERKAAREAQERAEAEEEMGYRVAEEVVGDEEDL
ncbi:hypothetical protein N0V88_004486 [Collariella sp. IMI 366227]|nr:hypothetical protein N0V88_004486 [Collariella sp. IMI 366227]